MCPTSGPSVLQPIILVSPEQGTNRMHCTHPCLHCMSVDLHPRLSILNVQPVYTGPFLLPRWLTLALYTHSTHCVRACTDSSFCREEGIRDILFSAAPLGCSEPVYRLADDCAIQSGPGQWRCRGIVPILGVEHVFAIVPTSVTLRFNSFVSPSSKAWQRLASARAKQGSFSSPWSAATARMFIKYLPPKGGWRNRHLATVPSGELRGPLCAGGMAFGRAEGGAVVSSVMASWIFRVKVVPHKGFIPNFAACPQGRHASVRSLFQCKCCV